MSEAYVECLVQAKPSTGAKIGKMALILVAVLSMLLSLVTGSIFLFIVTVICGVGAYYVNSFTEIEYEYLYLDKEITVDRVYNKTRRRQVAKYDLSRVEVFAPIKSYHLDNFGKRDNVKAVDYSIGYEEQPDRRYVMYYEGGGKILFSPNEEMVKVMKNAAPRKVFSD